MPFYFQRLRRELRVWKQLDHEHVLPLYGTASDFGHYTAFVCPWLENGTVSRYLERCGDVLSMMDRLGVVRSFVCENLGVIINRALPALRGGCRIIVL